ncbi:hypothetical protein CC2G_010459 [Coprinopsis cinerea AmutBmut pab1-1]|nr:hypothetical protein CC2G_010459 [Coprinopsis cinerea AmutBmut pab1-1]
MEYHPRYQQPFTLGEAIGLDPAIITEEISRLHNSLAKLKETQGELKKCIEEDNETDEELSLAFKENEDVIGSQEERIRMLVMALRQKGVITDDSHYGLPQQKETKEMEHEPTSTVENHGGGEGSDDGVYL